MDLTIDNQQYTFEDIITFEDFTLNSVLLLKLADSTYNYRDVE